MTEAEQERQAVLRYLTMKAICGRIAAEMQLPEFAGEHCVKAAVWQQAADAIERGEHIKETE